MRVAVVAGPDPGHAFPAIALCRRFLAAGDTPTLLTGTEWLDTARAAGVDAVELAGLDPTDDDDDGDAGAKIHQRAARMAALNLRQMQAMGLDLVVSDVITACGGMSAELMGIPWIELDPHPLYRPSAGLPPIGSGLAPGTGIRGRLRDAAMRALTARSVRTGDRQRAQARAEIGLPADDPGPLRMLIATLPALEVPRPDWPAEAILVGPLHFEPTEQMLPIPSGSGPVVVVAPSTATTGTKGMAETALECLAPLGARVVVSRLNGSDLSVPPWAVVGLGRQDALLAQADLAICGGGHGMVAKSLLAGVPLVIVPGGGDQWEIANRVVRQGSGRLVRPLTGEALVRAAADVLATPSYRAAAQRAAAGAADVADPVQVCHQALVGAGWLGRR
jgi:UDP:flavonoid glycosyltransferase YjiC (YdhE family)